MYQAVVNAHVLELQAGQRGQERVRPRVQSGRDNVDDFDRAGFAGARLEEFLLAAADGAIPKLALYNLQPFLNFFLVDAGAISTEQELADVGGNRVLPGELPHQVFADDVSFKCLGGETVQVIEFHHGHLASHRHRSFFEDVASQVEQHQHGGSPFA